MSDVTPVRDPDALLTPHNAVLALIDYQKEQYAGAGADRLRGSMRDYFGRLRALRG